MAFVYCIPGRRLRPRAGWDDLEKAMGRAATGAQTQAQRTPVWVPRVDMYETDNAYVLEVDLPGMAREDIRLTCLDDRVTVEGERSRSNAAPMPGQQVRERPWGRFQRTVRIPGRIDVGTIEATYEAGVLRVSLPKPVESRPRKIEVAMRD